MRKLLVCLVFVSVIVLNGCGKTPEEQFVNSIDETLQVIAPEYKEYVDKDEDISEGTKDIRKGTMNLLVKLVEDEKQRIKESKEKDNKEDKE